MRPNSVSAFVEADDDLMLFCGMAIGYKDPEAPVNALYSDREALDVWAKFI